MWKKLVAAVIGLGLNAGGAAAQNPQPPESGAPTAEPTAAEKLLAEPTPEPRYAYNGVLMSTPSPLAAFRSPGWSAPAGNGFGSALFATPLPGRAVVPEGAQLAAPVILPVGTKHGQVLYDVTPAGRVDVFDPVATRHPEDFVFGPASDPLPWRVWGSAEVLLGTTRAANVPPVVTTGPAALGFGTAGTLGAPGTVPLFGGRKMLDDWRAGLRAELGVWFDDARVWGGVARFYTLYSTSDQFVGRSNGANVVAIPEALPVGPEGNVVPIYAAFPGLAGGSVWTTAQTSFSGGDISVRRMLRQGPGWRLDVLAGYRQLHLGDELADAFQTVPTRVLISPGLFPPLVVTGADSLRTRNNFFGAQLGGIASAAWNRWSAEGYGAVALGVDASELNYDRSLDAGLGASPRVQTSVAESTDYFGTVWEGGLKVGYRVGSHLRLTMGYTLISWWNLRRAQEQSPSPRPLGLGLNTTGATTNFSAHVLSWGAELRY